MHDILLILHSFVRWLVVIFALAAVIRALIGWQGKKEWTGLDDRLGMLFTISLDIQFLLGLILYIMLIATMASAGGGVGAALTNPATIFWTREHIPLMLLGVIVAHIGRARARKAADPVARHKQSAIFYGLAILAILVAIPWPFMPSGRPLIRL